MVDFTMFVLAKCLMNYDLLYMKMINFHPSLRPPRAWGLV